MSEHDERPEGPHRLKEVCLESCPKCHFAHHGIQPECARCGLIYAKYRPRQSAADELSSPHFSPIEPVELDGLSWRHLFLSAPTPPTPVAFVGRTVLLLVLIIWGWTFMTNSIASNHAGTSVLHMVNLAFHEAGHVFFGFFGRFLMSLGGSLAQVLMPAICLVVLLVKTRDAFGAAVALWWVAQNFMDIAPYINDARARQLLLLGGVTGRDAAYGYHDWEFILTETGLLRYDHTLAQIANGLGILFMLTSLLWAGVVLFHQYQQLRRESD